MNRYSKLLTLLALCTSANTLFSTDSSPIKSPNELLEQNENGQEGNPRDLFSLRTNVFVPRMHPKVQVDAAALPSPTELHAAVDKGWVKGQGLVQGTCISPGRIEATHELFKAFQSNPQCMRRNEDISAQENKENVLRCAQVLGEKSAIFTLIEAPMSPFVQEKARSLARYMAVLHAERESRK